MQEMVICGSDRVICALSGDKGNILVLTSLGKRRKPQDVNNLWTKRYHREHVTN